MGTNNNSTNNSTTNSTTNPQKKDDFFTNKKDLIVNQVNKTITKEKE